MFRPDAPGSPRSAGKNALLAGYLAFVAGFVNSGGFVLIGSFTSHVTGSIGRFGNDLAVHNNDAAAFAALLILTFFGGALIASLIIETAPQPQKPRAYGIALFVEGMLLLAFIFVAGLSRATNPRALDAEAAMVCLAMGMQNSLVTRLSGAIIRTTHMTGVVTDLGIEGARWLHWYRSRKVVGVTADRPALPKTLLLLTIACSFSIGAVSGATLTLRISRWAMLFPAFAIWAMASIAFRTDGRASINAVNNARL